MCAPSLYFLTYENFTSIQKINFLYHMIDCKRLRHEIWIDFKEENLSSYFFWVYLTLWPDRPAIIFGRNSGHSLWPCYYGRKSKFKYKFEGMAWKFKNIFKSTQLFLIARNKLRSIFLLFWFWLNQCFNLSLFSSFKSFILLLLKFY